MNRALVLEYLHTLSETLAPRTVLVHRNTLKLSLKEVFGVDFDHEHFSLPAKAHFRRKPPSAKIVPTWSLENALDKLKKEIFQEGDHLSTFLKALFLLAVASANRASELAAIDRSRLSFRAGAVVLPLRAGFIAKNQTSSHSLSLIEIRILPDSPLCPDAALRAFLRVTAGSKTGGLFLKPESGKELNAGGVSYWLVRALEGLLLGSLGRGHDIRKLSTSLAWFRGVKTDAMVAAASWRGTNTFFRKYLVPSRSSGSLVTARHVM